ncbi:MAG: DUF3794 domain-containing protein [Clostridiales bacterium]|nr:DUF3794 domain-containing protein [Clostridiales bacterium]MCF8022097.1 DUF3794 domain-containing protein [Clostridiales bacterium]
MGSEFIEVSGVTPEDNFPACFDYHPFVQVCETDVLSVPCHKPEIKDILQVNVSISVSSFKTICTPAGKKLVIEGIKHIKIIFEADMDCQSVHSAHFDVPFCIFVKLRKKDAEVVDVKTAIEYISVNQIDCKTFSISIIIFARPEFKEKDTCPDCKDCYSQSGIKYNKKYCYGFKSFNSVSE